MAHQEHSKLEPIIRTVDETIDDRNFGAFIRAVEACMRGIKVHMEWEDSERGVLNRIARKRPDLQADIEELRSDHETMMNQLKKAVQLAHMKDDLAFVLFERFKMRRQEHVYHEDEIDVAAHSVPFSTTFKTDSDPARPDRAR